MIGAGRTVIRGWWMQFLAGLRDPLTVLAVNLIGEGLNDALNPRLRSRDAQ
jgi:peptide/nickel transport system permease protein